MERTMREGSKKIEAVKLLVTLVGLCAFLYFVVRWVILIGLLVFITWNDHHF
jgi:hypothetical protein